MSFMAVMPAIIAGHPASRAFVSQRMLWPYSRAQFVQGFGLLLAMACVVCWLTMYLIPFVCLTFVFGIDPLTPRAMQMLTLSFAALPLYFGLLIWPWRSLQLAFPIILIGVFVALAFFAGDAMHEWDGRLVAFVAAIVASVGCGGTLLSYRRWLANDIE
jgi:hypothetical protein